jgi:Tfp pilus assembly protein FimT
MKCKVHRQAGHTLAELLVVVAVLGTALGATALYLRPVEAPLKSATTLLEGGFRAARLRAMATTMAWRVSPLGSGELTFERADTCSATSWTADDTLRVEFPDGVALTAIDWSVCFNSRGISDQNLVVTLSHSEYGTSSVEVLLGGTTRVLP